MPSTTHACFGHASLPIDAWDSVLQVDLSEDLLWPAGERVTLTTPPPQTHKRQQSLIRITLEEKNITSPGNILISAQVMPG